MNLNRWELRARITSRAQTGIVIERLSTGRTLRISDDVLWEFSLLAWCRFNRSLGDLFFGLSLVVLFNLITEHMHEEFVNNTKRSFPLSLKLRFVFLRVNSFVFIRTSTWCKFSLKC